jgi:Fe-Mn family superoxide dismutase
MNTTVRVRPLLFKPHRLDGLSERLLVSHYENNYGGALRRLNAIEERLADLDWSRAPVFEINGLKREELIVSGSVILHQVYFDGLGGTGGDPPAGSAIAQAIERDFGSIGAWGSEFTGVAKAQGGGSGWTLLVWSERLGRLVNQWAADHAHGLPGGEPILALDMYEHAYHLDFGARAASYVDAIMANLHWERIDARFRAAMGEESNADDPFLPAGAPTEADARVDVEELQRVLAPSDGARPPYLVDVCLAIDLPRRTDMLPGAVLRAPETIGDWTEELPRDRPIVVCCIFGFQVSGETTIELRRRGYNARSLAGGIAAWHAIGGATVPIDTGTYASVKAALAQINIAKS